MRYSINSDPGSSHQTVFLRRHRDVDRQLGQSHALGRGGSVAYSERLQVVGAG